jgi:hypothetical protein
MAKMYTRRAFLVMPAGFLARAQPQTLMPEIPPGELKEVPDTEKHFAGKWTIQYQYEQDDETLQLVDIQFFSATHGLAAGTVFKEGNRKRALVLRTTDGGANWREIEVRDVPLSLFVLDGANAWMVTNKGLWFSGEGGLAWEKRRLPKNMMRVRFLDPKKGWAFGAGKIFYSTTDGGQTWQPVPESKDLAVTSDWASLNWMEFVNARIGMLVGNSKRPQPANPVPDWMLPERAVRRRLTPGTIISVGTNDAGKTWSPNVASVFGEIAKLRMRGVRGLSLLVYNDGFSWPSELNLIDLRTAKSRPVFRKPDLLITDIVLLGESGILAAAIQPLGRLRTSAIAGKVRMIWSPNENDWYNLKVDYRAEGTYAAIGHWGDDQFWVATNAGMILHLGG